jgi:GNAT superfamily N-acetyltransferase
MDVQTRRTDILSQTATDLIASLNQELSALYPEPGATHFRLDPNEVAPGRGAFLVAYADGQPVGCGAVRLIDARDAEVKRMYVARIMRGRGIGRALLDALEVEARELGATRLVLETGIRQQEALKLYRRAQFVDIPAYGEYVASPDTSVCMAKELV